MAVIYCMYVLYILMYNLRRWHYTCVDLQAIVANGFTVPEDYDYNGVLYLEGFGFYANEDPQSEGFYLDEVSFSHSARNLNTTVYDVYIYSIASEPANESYNIIAIKLQTAVQGYNWLVWLHHVLASIFTLAHSFTYGIHRYAAWILYITHNITSYLYISCRPTFLLPDPMDLFWRM